MKKRYLRMGIRFDDLRGMSLNELGHLFTHEFDENVYLVDVRDDITSGYTFYLLESSVFKEVEEGQATPVVFARQKSEYCSDGEYETFWAVEDYSEHVELNPQIFDEASELAQFKTFKPVQEKEHQDLDFSKHVLDSFNYTTQTVVPEKRRGWNPTDYLAPYQNHINKIANEVISKNEKEIEKAVVNGIIFGTGIWDCGVTNSTTAVQLYNPLTGNFDEYEGPTSELLEILDPPVKSGERICCGATPKWVDNGIGFQYHLCKTCGKEVE